MSEFAIDGIPAVAADDDGDLDVRHGGLTLGYGLIPSLDR
jgi:hypothetical protein